MFFPELSSDAGMKDYTHSLLCSIHTGLPGQGVVTELHLEAVNQVPAERQQQKQLSISSAVGTGLFVTWAVTWAVTLADLQMELRPCRMTPVKRVSFLASTSSHCFVSSYWAHHAPS